VKYIERTYIVTTMTVVSAKRIWATVVVFVALFVVSTPARAQDGPTVDPDVENLGGGVIDGAVRYGAGRGSIGAADVPCTWDVMDYLRYQDYWGGYVGSPNAGDPQTPDEPDPNGNFENDWVVILCRDGSGLINNIDTFQLGDPPDPAVLVQNARRQMAIPLPAAHFSPDPGAGAPQVVGLETWVWVSDSAATDLAVSACVPGVPAYACVTITATFLGSGFAMGDDTAEFFCDGAGVAYDADRSHGSQVDDPHCGHVYTEAEPGGTSYDAVATTFWHVIWTCSYDADLVGGLEAGCGAGDLGVIGRTAAAVPLEVLDLQARAVPG
jgi:hypothetical protein